MTSDHHGPGPGPTPAWAGRVLAPAAVDVLLFVVVSVLAVGLFVAGGESDARGADVVGAGLLVASAAPLVVRRRWPVLVLVFQLALVLVYLSLDYAGGAELPVVLAGIYSVAAAGRRWWVLAVILAFVGLGTAHRVVVEGEDALTVTIGSSLLVLVALLGDAVGTRRELRDEVGRRLAVMAAEKEAETRARMAEERLRLAHELHDVMAHTITTMTVQAGAAADQLDRDPDRARAALGAIRGAARDAMAELRAIIAVMRTPEDDDRGPSPGVARLDELVATTRAAGLRVTVDVDTELPQVLPTAVDVTCFRVVQEALTNVVRHAEATHASVVIAARRGEVVVEVTDDGRGEPTGVGAGGYGLVGLRERVSAVGGRLEAGTRPTGGFRVVATLPVAREVAPDGR